MGKISSRRNSRGKDLRRREESPSGTKGSSLQLGQEHLRHMRGRGSQLEQALKAILSSLVFVLVTQSCLTLCDPRTVVCQAPLSMGFSRQEYWSSLPYPSTGDLPDPGTEPRSSALQGDSLPSEPPRKSPLSLYFTYLAFKIK